MSTRSFALLSRLLPLAVLTCFLASATAAQAAIATTTATPFTGNDLSVEVEVDDGIDAGGDGKSG